MRTGRMWGTVPCLARMGTWVGKKERVRQTGFDGFGMETQRG